ncbi:MAG: thioredoxin domain-containing protein [Deltaproteobacteria bacterium]|nr:thioredoxin domain-containing protein [Deltaproteobacteria bacterium]
MKRLHRSLLLVLATLLACASQGASGRCPARTPTGAPLADSTRLPVGRSPTLGRADALLTIVEFGALDNPRCARAEVALTRARLQYGEDLRVVWRHNPGGRPESLVVAEAAQEAFVQGGNAGFWAFHDLLLDAAWEHPLRPADLEDYARRAGLDVQRFRVALAEHTHLPVVRADQELARSVGAREAPDLFVNGTQVPGLTTYARLRDVLDRVQAHARAIANREQVYALMTEAPVRLPGPPVVRTAGFGCRRAGDGSQDAPAEENLDADRIPVSGSPSLGCPDALVTVVQFGDFQCPFCSRVEDTLTELRAQYGEDVRIVWKNNPLPFHGEAQLAAEAALEAYAQRGNEGFWLYHDALFDNTDALQREDLERYAEQTDLDLERFRAALDNHTHREEIERDQRLAERLGAEGVPNFFINGTNLVGAVPLETFQALVDPVLERARSIDPRQEVYARMVADPVAAPDPNNNVPTPPPAPPAPQEDPTAVYAVPIDNAPVQGPATALVTMVIYGDFQCPFCGRVQATLRDLRARYGNDLRIAFRNEPLPFHDRSRLAAEAAREAYAQRGNAGFWRYHDALFSGQNETDALTRPHLERLARAQGLNLPRFRAALDSHRHGGVLDAEHAAGALIEASSTPHFFINGRRFVGAQPVEDFVRLIDEVRDSARELLRTHPNVNRGNLYAYIVAHGSREMVYLPQPGANVPSGGTP